MKIPEGSDHLVGDIKEEMQKITSLPLSEVSDKIVSGKRMIEYFSKQTSEIETRRIKLADNNYTRLSLSLVVVGLIASMDLTLYIKLILILPITIFVVSSVAVLIEYHRQSNFNYPWKQDLDNITNQWNWFYYGNPKLKELTYRTEPRFESDNWVNYKKGLLYFINRTIELTPQEELESVLYQQFLLQAHNAFKNQFYLQLLDTESSYLTQMIRIVSLLAVVMIIIKIF